MDNVDNRRVHRRCRDVVIRAQQELAQRAAQLLSVAHIDSDKLQNAVLCDHTENMGTIGLAIIRNEGNPARARLEHASACFVEGTFWVNGDSLGRRDAQCLFNLCSHSGYLSAWHRISRVEEHQRTAQAVEPELVDLIQGGWVLEIVLDDIDVVGGGQQTRELGRL